MLDVLVYRSGTGLQHDEIGRERRDRLRALQLLGGRRENQLPRAWGSLDDRANGGQALLVQQSVRLVDDDAPEVLRL